MDFLGVNGCSESHSKERIKLMIQLVSDSVTAAATLTPPGPSTSVPVPVEERRASQGSWSLRGP